MDRADLIALIATCCRDNLPPSADNPGTLGENTHIFGRGGVFDSMQLLYVLIEVEQRVNEHCGTTISIADDRAMSQQRSPFRTIGTLADYVSTLVAEQKRPAEK